MIEKFRSNFEQCLGLFRQEIAGDSALLTLSTPFYGLYDPSVYEKWKLSSDLRYFEASNLLYVMKNTTSLREELKELAAEFIAEGYDAIASPDLDSKLIKEQLKLIYIILRGKLIVPADEK